MPQVYPKCRQLQPDGPCCLNCRTKFEMRTEATQSTRLTLRQLRDLPMAILGLITLELILVIAINATILALAD